MELNKNLSCGVYIIINNLNGKYYIGSSVNIERRWHDHRTYAKNNKLHYSNELYDDMKRLGNENFTFEILEECEPEKRLEKELNYIKEYEARTEKGYNKQGLDRHHNHKLTKEDVIDIRNRYNNHEDKNSVYYDYENRIGHTGFHKIWCFETWKEIMPEVYTEENRKWHNLHGQSRPGSKNPKAKLTEKDVLTIRNRRRQGEKIKDVYDNYSDRLTFGSFSNVWYYRNWPNVP